jgi:hypothetical protein
MRYTVLAMALCLPLLPACQTTRTTTLWERERAAWPSSIDESMAYLSLLLNAKDDDQLVSAPETELARRCPHLVFFVQKRFGLDHGNVLLLRAAGRNDSQDAAIAILAEYRSRMITAMSDPVNYE